MFPNVSSTSNILFTPPSPSCHYLFKELIEDTKWTKTGTVIAVTESRGDVQARLPSCLWSHWKDMQPEEEATPWRLQPWTRSDQQIARHESSGLAMEASKLLKNSPPHPQNVSALLSSFFPNTRLGLFIANGITYLFVWLHSHLVFLFIYLLSKGCVVNRTCSEIFRSLVSKYQ